MKDIKLSDYAKIKSVTYRTVWNRFKQGKHEEYLGKRIKRGLFKTEQGKIINADVNGSYNIMKKAIPNAFANGIEGFGVNPIVLTIKK